VFINLFKIPVTTKLNSVNTGRLWKI